MTSDIPWAFTQRPGILTWTWTTAHFVGRVWGSTVDGAPVSVVRSYAWELGDLIRAHQGMPRVLVEGMTATFDASETAIREHVGKCYDPRLGYSSFSGPLATTFTLASGERVDVEPMIGTRCTVDVGGRERRTITGDLSVRNYSWRLRTGDLVVEVSPEHVLRISTRRRPQRLPATSRPPAHTPDSGGSTGESGREAARALPASTWGPSITPVPRNARCTRTARPTGAPCEAPFPPGRADTAYVDLMTAVTVGLVGVVGLLVGSFLNVIVYRVPQGLSVVRPGSACPGCGHPIEARDNVPVLSWLLLRGRCRQCRVAISMRYPLTEVVTGLTWAALAMWCLAGSGGEAMLPTLLVVSAACIALWQIDVLHHRLPNVIVYPLYPLVAVGLVFACVMSGRWPLLEMLGATAVWLAVFGGLHLVTRGRGMGMGDVKLAPVLASVLGWYGWGPAVLGLFVAFVVGGVVGTAMLLAGRSARRAAIPFGPFMIVGVATGALFGTAAGQWYVGLA